MLAKSKQPGFTIVELLIVIVVIGILAAVTLIAYNGIQNRAKVASLQTDLENSTKTLDTYKYANAVTSGGEYYPATSLAANLKGSTGTIFQYTPSATSNPTGYCLSATNGTLNYSVSNANTSVVPGLCVVNYIPDPSAEGSTNLVVSSGTPGITISPTTFTGWPINGTKSFKIAATVTTDTRVRPITNTIPAINGKAIETSAYVYNASAGPRIFDVTFQARNSGGSPSTVGPTTTFTIPAGQSAIVSNVLPSTVDLSSYVYIEPMFNREAGSGATASSASDVFYMDSMMLTYFDTIQTYADGNTPGWQWLGTVNDSTSLGPL